MMWQISDSVAFILVLLRFSATCSHLKDIFIASRSFPYKEEAYAYGNFEYRLVVSRRATWKEAQILCEESINGTLATADHNDVLEFWADVLAETDFETVESVWVGGAKNGSDFYWTNGKPFTELEFYQMINRSAEDCDDERNVSGNCVAFERFNHAIPHLINMDCGLPRAYLCQTQRTVRNSLDEVNWIRVQDCEYTIIRQSLNWKKAVTYCKEVLNAQIATFRNINEVHSVARYMLIGRPSLENAWIGGYFDSSTNDWRFISTGKLIPLSNETTDFPPWHLPNKKAGCLSLDRHSTNIHDFVASECSKLKAFVCERPLLEGVFSRLFSKKGVVYYLGMDTVTWNEAKQRCEFIKGMLAKITKDILKEVIYNMGERQIEIKHIWIGGKYCLNQSSFKWIKDDSVISSQIEDDYPPWYDYDNAHGLEENCLNLDRENHNHPLFYGIACGAHQAFICEKN